jgi:hypothetical protein
MNKNITSNTELIDIIKKENIKNFNGVYPKDKLNKPLKDGFYIINLQDSDKGSGTHWTAIYKINDGFSFYYDSFGFPAPENIEDTLHKYEYNKNKFKILTLQVAGFIVWRSLNLCIIKMIN